MTGGLNHETLEPGYKVTKKSSVEYELKLWGKMPIGWITNLTRGIAGTGISIQRGSVQKVSGYCWNAGFELKSVCSDAVPEHIDYINLAGQRGGTAATTFVLDGFTVKEPADDQSPLYLEVRAADQKGFLGALMSKLAFFSLFPEEMAIETTGGRIHDRFWLKRPGGLSPSVEVAAILEKSLAARICSRAALKGSAIPFGHDRL